MLWNASVISGYSVSASDGKIGTISDFLFDDTNWLMRWLVVDTGNWLLGRRVLLPSSALAHLDAETRECSIKLTMQQIKDSPDVDTERPVSRQMESHVYGYYGYLPYWSGGYGLMGAMGGYGYLGGMGGAMPISSPSQRLDEDIAGAQQNHDDVHLRSVAAVTSYHIHASDGEIGHVETFLIEDADWSIRYLVVDTKNWWPGKKVLISPLSIRDISWLDRLVNLNTDRLKVKEGPAYDEAMKIDHAYDEKLRAHYGISFAMPAEDGVHSTSAQPLPAGDSSAAPA
jgi:hypothetical protein